MANPTDVLYQLQLRLNTINQMKDIKISSKEDLGEDIGNASTFATGSAFGSSLANKRYSGDDEDIDVVDAAAVDEPYVTHTGTYSANNDVDDTKIKIEQIFSEEAPPEEMPPEEAEAPVEAPPAEGGAEMPPEGMEGMPPEGGMEMPGQGGMPGMGEEEIKSPSELGRIYELKKIYTRLTTIESYLSDSSEPDLLRIRLLVSKGIELFEILSSNIPTYRPPKAPKERIDEIIVMYYKFLKQVYESVAKYYKDRQASTNDNILQKINLKIAKKELI